MCFQSGEVVRSQRSVRCCGHSAPQSNLRRPLDRGMANRSRSSTRRPVTDGATLTPRELELSQPRVPAVEQPIADEVRGQNDQQYRSA